MLGLGFRVYVFRVRVYVLGFGAIRSGKARVRVRIRVRGLGLGIIRPGRPRVMVRVKVRVMG